MDGSAGEGGRAVWDENVRPRAAEFDELSPVEDIMTASWNDESGAGVESPPDPSLIESITREASARVSKSMRDQMLAVGGDVVLQTTKSIASDGAQRLRTYANMELLKPYFDIDGKTVLLRSAHSLLPTDVARAAVDSPDLYGPLMIVFSLVVILVYGMNLYGPPNHLREATVLGTCFFAGLMYWLGGSALFFALSFIFDTRLGIAQILHSVGYSMASTCLVMLLGIFLSGAPFALVFVVIDGLSGMVLGRIYYSKTAEHGLGAAGAAVVAVLHLLFTFITFLFMFRGK